MVVKRTTLDEHGLPQSATLTVALQNRCIARASAKPMEDHDVWFNKEIFQNMVSFAMFLGVFELSDQEQSKLPIILAGPKAEQRYALSHPLRPQDSYIIDALCFCLI